MTSVLPLQFVPVEPAAAAGQLQERLLDRRLRQEFPGDEAAARDAAARAIAGVLDTLEPNDVVTAAGSVVGRVWLQSRDDELNVVDLVLDDSALAAGDLAPVIDDVHRWAESVARERGAARMTVPVPPGDTVVAGLVRGSTPEGRGYQLGSTNMRLDLALAATSSAAPDIASDPTSGGPAVIFEPMPESDWPVWKQWQVDGYAEARHLAGESLETAQRVAAVSIDELLPDGLATAGNHVFVVRESGSQQQVGILWLSTERSMAYVYDIEIEPDQRRKGFGAATMRAAAEWARARGHAAMGLNVFGYNTGARALYESLGYEVLEEFYGRELADG